jgi:hypothetical protein
MEVTSHPVSPPVHPEYPVPGRTRIPSHLPCPRAASPLAPFAKRDSLASERERKESSARAGGRIEFLIERERERERVCVCVCDRRDRVYSKVLRIFGEENSGEDLG